MVLKKTGHTAWAVDQIDKNGKATGQVLVFDKSPDVRVVKENTLDDVPGSPGFDVVEKGDLLTWSGREGIPVEGVIENSTETEKGVDAISKLFSLNSQQSPYNAKDANCTDHALEIGDAGGITINGDETACVTVVSGSKSTLVEITATTPNESFKEGSKLKNATVIKQPSSKANYSSLYCFSGFAVRSMAKRIEEDQKVLFVQTAFCINIILVALATHHAPRLKPKKTLIPYPQCYRCFYHLFFLLTNLFFRC